MFFNKGFNGAKCKTMLKLTIPRIKLLRNRRDIQLKQMRKDIAKLIENGQEATARIRVEHIVREENMMAAQEILELFCELVSVRLPIIETQRECPLDLKEAISSICFAAPRCADLPELQQVQMLFSMKYGKDFVAAASELMPDCGVNRQIIELLSIRAPSVEVKMKLLKDIAEKHGLDWDPSASEAELLKPHEDLLNGPDHFTNGSTMRLPTEKHDNSSSTSHVNEYVGSDSDAELDSLDLPEVPRETIRTISDVPSAPGIVSHVPPSQPHDFGPHVPSPKPEVNSNASGDGNKQFLPFVIPPSSTFPAPDGESESAISPPLTHHLETPNFGEPTEASLSYSENISREDSKSLPHLPTDSVFSSHLNQSEPSSLISPSISPTKQSEPVNSPPPSTFTTSYQNDNSAAPTFSRTRSEINTDLQDVLAAAMAAAETAERAAAAARAAASLAEVKIADFVTKEKKTASGRPDAERQSPDSHRLPNSLGNPIFDHQDSFNRAVEETSVMETKSTGFEDSPQSVHAPQRLPSLEEDPYFSYPNLFSPKDVDGKSGTEGPSSNSHNG